VTTKLLKTIGKTDIFPDQKIWDDSIIIHDYLAKMSSFKGKTILHKNAVSLVISGKPTLVAGRLLKSDRPPRC